MTPDDDLPLSPRMSSRELLTHLHRVREAARMENPTLDNREVTHTNGDMSILASVGSPPWDENKGSTAAGWVPRVGDVPPFTPYSPIPPVYPGQSLPNSGRVTTTSTTNPPKKEETMDVWMIWVRDKDDPQGILWLEEAWDDDAVSGNPDGWREAVDKAFALFGGNHVRVLKTSVNFDKIQAAFEPASV